MKALFAELEREKKKAKMNHLTKNPEALEREYLPKEILFRDKQKKEVGRILLNAAQGKNTCAWIGGNFGTGKTAVVRSVINEFNMIPKYDKTKVVYINCKEYGSEYEILRQICGKLSTKPLKLGMPLGVIVDDLKEKRKKFGSLVIILDELDKILKAGDDAILYRLLEFPKTTILVISNDARWKEYLSGATYSRVRGAGKDLWFPPYDLYELEEILKSRILEAGIPECSSKVIEVMAEAIHDAGDARNLLLLLSLVVSEAECVGSATLEVEHVIRAKKGVSKEITTRILKTLGVHQRIMVDRIAYGQGTGYSLSTEEVRRKYEVILKDMNEKKGEVEHVDTLTKSSIYRILSELEGQGMVYKEPSQYIAGVGRKPHVWKTFWTEEELREIWSAKK